MKLKDLLTDWRSLLKLLLFLIVAVVGIIILSAAMKVWFAYSIYSFFLQQISSVFGLDAILARPAAVVTTAATLIVLPWLTSFLLFGRKKKQVLIAGSIVLAVWTLSLYYGTDNVFFDRNTGKPAKYYIKTLAGFKFSSTDDFDPQFGIKYKPIDAQTVQEYYLWKKTGKMQVPTVQPGKYFDIITGEPIVWYADRPDGSIELFPLPGYDPLTGQALRPMTKEMAESGRGVTSSLPKPRAVEPSILVGNEELQKGMANFMEDSKDRYVVRVETESLLDRDLEWYFKARELKAISATKVTIKNSEGKIFMDIYVEKILFIPPRYTVVGLCYQPFINTEINFLGNLSINGRNYEPIKIITDDKRGSSSELFLWEGKTTRVLYVLDYLPAENFIFGFFWSKAYDFKVGFSTKDKETGLGQPLSLQPQGLKSYSLSHEIVMELEKRDDHSSTFTIMVVAIMVLFSIVLMAIPKRRY